MDKKNYMKLWSKLKWRQLFLSRPCINKGALRLSLLSSWEQSLVPLFTGQHLRSWEVSASSGQGTSTATAWESIIQKLIWQDSSYHLVHCIFVLQGHQNCNKDQPSCCGTFFLSTSSSASFSMWQVLAGVSPAAKVSWLEKLQPSESGRRYGNANPSSLPQERSCCEITLQDIYKLFTHCWEAWQACCNSASQKMIACCKGQRNARAEGGWLVSNHQRT